MKLPWRQSTDTDIAEEIRQHIDEAVIDLMAGGMTRTDAEAAARRRFGNVTLIEERSRDVWRWRLASDFAADLRYALRQMRRTPAFAAAAIATLALGIGATTTIFSIADAALLNPLPFPNPDRLVTLNEIVPLIADRPIRVPAPDLIDYGTQSRSFDAVAGWTPRTFELSGERESERVQAARATSSLFDVLGAGAALGRTYSAEEDRDAVAVCVISDGLWRRWFGADPAVLGRTIRLDRQPYRVIGVMPRDFAYPLRGTETDTPTDIWVPMSFTAEERAARADNWDYNGVARLKAGVTPAQASADVNAIAQRISRELGPIDGGHSFVFSAVARPLAPQVSGRVRPLVAALGGAVACLLLIACVNVANLLLARGAHRRREMAVRAALGAGRVRLLRQLLTEALLLSVIAAAAGAAIATWTTSVIASILPPRFALLATAHVSGAALAFTIALSLATTLLAGIIPGLSGAGDGRAASLNVRAEAGSTRLRRVRSALVVVEIALALVLLVGAGLLIRTFEDLLRTSAGFEPEHAVSAHISLPESQYATAASERELYRQILERLHGDGIELAGIGSTLPLTGRRSERVFWPDDYVPAPNAGFNIAGMSAVSAEYLQSIGATLKRGRFFTPQDDAAAAPVAIVNASLAQQYWPGQDPVGKRLKWGGAATAKRDWLQVVGVVGDLKQDSLDAPGAIQVFVPVAQLEHSMEAESSAEFTIRELREMYVVVRGRSTDAAMVARVRDTIRALDPNLAIDRLGALTDTVASSAAPQRFNMVLMGTFAGMALLLAIVGLYGLISYSVVQRSREIGVRMAMGAAAGQVTRMIVREGLTLACTGALLGAVAAAALAPALRSLLFGVAPLDPATFGVVIAVLLGIAAAATYVPARRVTAIDPATTLRAE